MKLAGFVNESIVDGPGVRIVLFFQGCKHHCPSCQNPKTWSFNDGVEVTIDQIDKLIQENSQNTSGVTLSGGDPFCDLKGSIQVAKLVKETYKLNLMAFTGYTYEEIMDNAKEDPQYLEILKYLDYLVDGRFVLALRSISINNRGSRNQRVIDVQATLKAKNKIVFAEKLMDMSFYN